jgi:hypothetical protein
MAIPQPGSVVDGYRFKGGNPNDQGAWEEVHGDDALAGLPPAQAAQVRAIAEGRMTFPSGRAMTDPHWQQLLGDVARYDPSFDAANPHEPRRPPVRTSPQASRRRTSRRSTP